MKKLYYLLFSISLLTSCTWSTSHESSATLMYAGRIVFLPTGDEIGAITGSGFLSFTNTDKQRLDIKSDAKRMLTYQLNNGDETHTPTNKEKALIKEAFKYCQQNGSMSLHSPFVLDEKAQK